MLNFIFRKCIVHLNQSSPILDLSFSPFLLFHKSVSLFLQCFSAFYFFFCGFFIKLNLFAMVLTTHSPGILNSRFFGFWVHRPFRVYLFFKVVSFLVIRMSQSSWNSWFRFLNCCFSYRLYNFSFLLCFIMLFKFFSLLTVFFLII